MSLPLLPDGYEWGARRGDYTDILRCGRKIAAFGGVACKVTPEDGRPAVLAYAIAKGERELAIRASI